MEELAKEKEGGVAENEKRSYDDGSDAVVISGLMATPALSEEKPQTSSNACKGSLNSYSEEFFQLGSVPLLGQAPNGVIIVPM